MPTVAFVNDPPTSATDPSSQLLVTDPLIGTQNTFTLRFDNVGATEADVGYAPYVDLFMPVTGKDGVAPGTPAANAYDGIDFVSATYLGASLKTTAVTLTASATGVPHPFAKDSSGNPRMLKLADFPGAKAGDKVYVLELPLGSYTPSQPPVDIVVKTQVSNLADVNQPLPIVARGGFRFGSDPLDNPTVDAPILGGSSTQAFTPTLYHVTKENLAPEYETATGPNFHQHYRIRVDVAPGQTLANLRLKDVLPNTLQYVGATVTGNGVVGTVTDEVTPSTSTPGGTLQRLLSSITGADPDDPSDAVLDIEYYVPYRDVAAATVLNPTTGDDVTIPNSAEASNASWTPIDTRDPQVTLPTVTVPTTGPLGVWDPKAEHPLVAKSIATQKSVSGTAKPGALLTYTINFQVSDYFAFQNLVLTDLLGDGQRLEGTPTLSVSDGHTSAGTTSGSFDAANYTTTVNRAGTNGKDQIAFRISDELVSRGFSNGRLVGGLVPAGGGAVPGTNVGGTTGTITFTARVQDTYDGTVPSGNPQIVANDLLDNTASIGGDILSNGDLSTKVGVEEDGTYAWTRVAPTSFSKAVYAKNGDATGSPLPATTLVTAGDTITYRITYTVPNSSFENLKLTDYLPLPLFDVDDAGTRITGFDAAASGTGDAPAAGKWTYGAGDTFHTLTSPSPTLPPSVAMDSAANSVTFNFGTFDDTQNRSSTIDLLFTVTASNRPFADNLKLANRATAMANNSANEKEQGEAIAEVTSSEPELKITKGVVATDNTVVSGVFSPGTVGPVPFSQPTGFTDASTRFTGTVTSSGLAATPINSNLAGVDNGDYVTYCIVVENRGSGKNGAYDVVIKDAPPPGLLIPGVGVQDINLRVTDGAGNPLAFTNIGAGLFDGGIRLDDGSTGAIGRGKDDAGNVVDDGSNIVVITYDMRVGDNVVLSKLTNTGAIDAYAATEGGPDFTGSGSLTDTAVITIGFDPLAKTFVGTSIVPGSPGDLSGNNANDEAVVGEFVDYKVTITVPEARMPGAVVTDTLDDGLAFVKLISTTVSPGVVAGTPTPSVSNGGRTVKFDFGTIQNLNTDNATPEKIELVYRAVVVNKQVIQGGVKRSNSATLTYKDGTADVSTTKRAAPITIIEPQVKVAKTAVFTSGSGSGTTTGEAGNSVSYTITISNPAGAQASTADAYDLTFADVLPAAIVNPSLASVTGIGAGVFELSGNTVRTKAGTTFDLGVNATPIVLTVTGTLAQSVSPGEVITNTATADWTSLDGDPGQLSPYSADAVERTGSLSPAYNDYRTSGSADLKVRNFGLTKSIVATSETNNGVSSDRYVVPGEIVRWRLVASIPGSMAAGSSLQLVDQLPNGLQFLNDGTAKLAIVSQGGVTSSLYAGQPPFVTGTTDVGVTPSYVIPAGSIKGGPFGDGTDVSFDLGRVVNTEGNDGNEEYAIVEFNALVLNVASNGVTNGVGNTLTNVFRTSRDGVLGTPSATEKVTLAEGLFESATKRSVAADDVTPADGPFDAGDAVRYRIDVAAAAGVARATLFDVDVVDPLVTGVLLDPSTIRVFRNGTQIFTGFTDTSTAGTAQTPGRVAIKLDRVDPGDQITVLYDVSLATTVSAGTSVPNSVLVTGTSLPGPNGTTSNPTGSTTPGTSGSQTGERDGSGGAINDYRITAGTSVLIATPKIEKTIFATSPVETQANQYDPDREDFAIGEIVTYRITVTLPEGRTPSLVVSDVLPGGGRMKLFTDGNGQLPTRVVSVGANIVNASLAAGAPGTVGVGGGTVTFNLGSVTNNPDNVVDENDQIVLEVKAQVMDVAANKAGATITNVGNLTYTVNGTPVTTTDSVTSDIVEPVLQTAKEVQKLGDADFVDVKKVDVGDTLVYRVTVRHAPTSTAPAYSVKIADTLPAGLTLLGAPVVVYHPNYASGFYDQPVVTTSGNGFTVLIDYLDHPDNALALGADDDIAVIEYSAQVVASPPKGSIQNTAVVTYDSLYGERSSVVSPDTTRDYRTSDPATVVVALNAISGYVYVDMNNDGVFDPDESPIAGVPIRLTGRDNLGRPVDMTTTTDATGNYIFAGLIPCYPGTTYTVTQVTQPTGYADGKDTVGTQFSGATPTADGVGSDRFINVLISANATTQLGEHWNFGERIETDLAIKKTDGTAIYRPDSTTTYRITVTNNGIWDVSGARVLDAGPTGTTPVSWRLASISGVGGITSGYDDSGAGISLDTLVDLAPGASATFEFTVAIPSGYTGLLTNVATVDPPDGWVDKTPGDNIATDTDSQQTLVVGSDVGCSSVPYVRVIDPATGRDLITPIQPYENGFRGGVRVTTGDIDADGTDEIIVVPGPGRPFEMKVYKQDGTPLPAYTMFPFGPGYTRGGEIAGGNVDGIGGDDLVVSAAGQVNVYLWQGGAPAISPTPAQSFRPFGNAYTGDVFIATGDFGRMSGGAFTKNPDGRFEIVTGTGLGARAQVRVYDVTGPATLVRQIQPISAGFTGGVSVSTGRYAKAGVADDGVDDVIVGAGFGGNSVVEVYDIWSKPLATTLVSKDAVARASAFAGLARPQAAVHTAALIDAAGFIDIYGVQGSGGFGSTNGVRKLGSLTGPQVQRNSLAAPLRIAAIRK